MKNRYFIYVFILLGLLAVSGCSKESNIVAPSGSTIEIIPTVTSISPGVTSTIKAWVKDADGNDMNGVGVIFESSSPSVVAFVDAGGLVNQKSVDTDDTGVATVTVQALSAGTATITATLDRATASTTLTVE